MEIQKPTITDLTNAAHDHSNAANGGTIPSTSVTGLGTLATQSGTFSGTSSGTNTGDQNIFQTIAVSGQSNVVADSTTDTLTLAAGSGITITTDASTDTVTIAASASSTVGDFQGFRLTLTSGNPAPSADVSPATTIYCTPYKGNKISLYNGSSWDVVSSSQFSLGLGTLTASLPYDVFCYNNSGTPTLEFTAWTDGTTRATALAYQDGVLVKSGATTRRYLGTFYTISTTQTADTQKFRYLWNYYHRIPRRFYNDDSAIGSHTYSTASYRLMAGNDSALYFVSGVAEDCIVVTADCGYVTNSGATARAVRTSISLDSTVNAYLGYALSHCTNATAQSTGNRSYTVTVTPQLGYHYLGWLEFGAGSDTQTWNTNIGTGSGIKGWIMA